MSKVNLLCGVMVVAPNMYGRTNIGDYIQALAAKQFIGETDIYIERDHELNVYNGKLVKMIMNGWFMDYGENFPPVDSIKPLYVAFHINKLGLPGLLSSKAIEHYKKHQPIGCRDEHTAELLRKHGVDAYFSGCLTLTLGMSYRSDEKDGNVYIVDPMYSTFNLSKRPFLIAKTFFRLLFNYRQIKTITLKRRQQGLTALFHNTIFYSAYRKAFSEDVLLNAEYIEHINDVIPKTYPDYQSKMDYAKMLINKYARAKLVITSKIHCALPCTGLETPVVYIRANNESTLSTDRYGGLIDLLNVLEWKGDGLNLPEGFNRITLNNLPKIKNSWRQYAESLISRCKDFVENN